MHTRSHICTLTHTHTSDEGLQGAGGEDHKMAFIRGSCRCELWRNPAFVLSQDLILLIEVTPVIAFSCLEALPAFM